MKSLLGHDPGVASGDDAGRSLGAVLVLASVGGLFAVEHHTIGTAQSLEEGAGKVVTVEAGKVDPADDGKLVHVTGPRGGALPFGTRSAERRENAR